MTTRNQALPSVPPPSPEPEADIPVFDSDDPGVVAVMEVLDMVRKCQALLKTHFRPLPAEERKSLPPVPRQFGKVGVTMVEALRPQTALLTLMEDFDIERMASDMDRVLALTALANQIEQLADVVSDSSAFHESRAYSDVLPVYAVAKVRSERDASMRAVVAPLEKVFAGRSRRRKDPEQK